MLLILVGEMMKINLTRQERAWWSKYLESRMTNTQRAAIKAAYLLSKQNKVA